MHRNSLLIFERYGPSYLTPGAKVLEIGSDSDLVRDLVTSRAVVACWDPVDFTGDGIVTYAPEDPYSSAIASGSFAAVISRDVAEHVPKVWRYVTEMARACVSGLMLIAKERLPFVTDPGQFDAIAVERSARLCPFVQWHERWSGHRAIRRLMVEAGRSEAGWPAHAGQSHVPCGVSGLCHGRAVLRVSREWLDTSGRWAWVCTRLPSA